MLNVVLLILYFIVLAAYYIIVLSQKGERKRMKSSLKSQDWIVFFSLIFGGVVISQLLMDLVEKLPTEIMMGGLILLFLVMLGSAIYRKKKNSRPMVRMMGDERTNAIYSKSARNGLFATYLVLFVNQIVVDTEGLDANWMLIMVGSGMVALLVSIVVYNNRM